MERKVEVPPEGGPVLALGQIGRSLARLQDLAHHGPGFGITGVAVDVALHQPRQGHDVVIEEEHQLTAGRQQTPIHRPHQMGLRKPLPANQALVVPLLQGPGGGGFMPFALVDHQQLPGAIELGQQGQQGPNRVDQNLLAPVGGDHNAEHGAPCRACCIWSMETW